MKRKMKWILIENIMGHKYTRWKQKKRKYPNEKKPNLKSPINYNILKWELKIFDTCIMAITCTSGFGATNAQSFTCWWHQSQMLIVTYEVLVYNLDY